MKRPRLAIDSFISQPKTGVHIPSRPVLTPSNGEREKGKKGSNRAPLCEKKTKKGEGRKE